jgi:hypothetical protein
VLSRLGFFGLTGGAGLRCAADVLDDNECTEGEGESDGREDGGFSLAVLRRGGSCGVPFASKGSGSLRGAVLEATLEDLVTLEDGVTLSTLTQSGSSLGVNGFGDRAGFGT